MSDARPYQTRSDEMSLHAGLCYWRTLHEAFQATREDPDIWEISWHGQRWVRKQKAEIWSAAEEKKIASLSLAYQEQKGEFWVRQDVRDISTSAARLLQAYQKDQFEHGREGTEIDRDELQFRSSVLAITDVQSAAEFQHLESCVKIM